RVPLGVVGIEQALRRSTVHDLSQLPAQVHRVLHADVEALAAHGVMHVRGIACKQHTSLPVGRSLPRHVREAGDPGRAVDTEIRSPDRDERVAQIAQARVAALPAYRSLTTTPTRLPSSSRPMAWVP